MLSKMLVGNLLSMSKGLGYTVPARIEAETTLNSIKTKLKRVEVIGFIGSFRTNFEIPDFFGIGKSVSRGFGTVEMEPCGEVASTKDADVPLGLAGLNLVARRRKGLFELRRGVTA